MHDIWEVLAHSLMVAGFVFVMMLVIEYLNILTSGRWDKTIRERRWSQYLIAGLLGAVPGCLGSFAVIGLYSHRVITFGALLTAMIATTGDAAFVMLAEFPDRAIQLFGLLFVIGIAAGIVFDLLSGSHRSGGDSINCSLPVHHDDCSCFSFSAEKICAQWRKCSMQRGVLVFFLVLFILGIAGGELGHQSEWNWMRVTMLITVGTGLFIVATVPDHFLEEHLWNHIVKVHLWKVFLWTLGAFVVLHVLLERFELEELVKGSHMAMLVLLLCSCLVGLIPEVGPHLVFVTLFAQGLIPFSVLVAGSIVQDGHGMLPMLAHSRRAFFGVKLFNFCLGLCIGLIGYFTGW